MSDEERKDEEQEVEAHTITRPQGAEDEEAEEPDVEAHTITRPQ
jgi:hypothetical protein